MDRLSPREGRGVAFLGEIALLAVPQSTLAQAAESCELPSLPKKLKSVKGASSRSSPHARCHCLHACWFIIYVKP